MNVVAAFGSWGPVTWLEALWFLLGAVGFYFSAHNYAEALRDLEAVNMSGRNGRLRTIAVSNAREELLRSTKCVVIMLVGVLAMVTPPLKATQPISPLSIFITIGIFLISVLIVIGTLAGARTRRRVLEAARQLRQERDAGGG